MQKVLLSYSVFRYSYFSNSSWIAVVSDINKWITARFLVCFKVPPGWLYWLVVVWGGHSYHSHCFPQASWSLLPNWGDRQTQWEVAFREICLQKLLSEYNVLLYFGNNMQGKGDDSPCGLNSFLVDGFFLSVLLHLRRHLLSILKRKSKIMDFL